MQLRSKDESKSPSLDETLQKIEQIGKQIAKIDGGKHRKMRKSMNAIRTLIDDTEYIVEESFVEMLENQLKRLETIYKKHKRSMNHLIEERIQLKTSICEICPHNDCIVRCIDDFQGAKKRIHENFYCEETHTFTFCRDCDMIDQMYGEEELPKEYFYNISTVYGVYPRKEPYC